jgi:hypothetical protein
MDTSNCGSWSFSNSNGTCFLKPGPPTNTTTYANNKCNVTSGTISIPPPPEPLPPSHIAIILGVVATVVAVGFIGVLGMWKVKESRAFDKLAQDIPEVTPQEKLLSAPMNI